VALPIYKQTNNDCVCVRESILSISIVTGGVGAGVGGGVGGAVALGVGATVGALSSSQKNG
jgi:hypothetical protein